MHALAHVLYVCSCVYVAVSPTVTMKDHIHMPTTLLHQACACRLPQTAQPKLYKHSNQIIPKLLMLCKQFASEFSAMQHFQQCPAKGLASCRYFMYAFTCLVERAWRFGLPLVLVDIPGKHSEAQVMFEASCATAAPNVCHFRWLPGSSPSWIHCPFSCYPAGPSHWTTVGPFPTSTGA